MTNSMETDTRDRQPISQQSSRLMRLPGELRDLMLFTTTSPHSPAILRCCRQVHEEVKDMWPGLVLFDFEGGPEKMMDRFYVAPPAVLSQIRCVNIMWDLPLPLYYPQTGQVKEYTLAPISTLLPSLRLDPLTIVYKEPFELLFEDGPEPYYILNDLVLNGNGRKELRFIAADSTILGFAAQYYGPFSHRGVLQRKPQPATWAQTLRMRDGTATGATVTIYRADGLDTKAKAGVLSSVFDPRTRFEQTAPADLTQFGTTEEETLMGGGSEREKKILVVARRGRDVDVAEGTHSPYLQDDVRNLTYGMTWPEIRRDCIDCAYWEEIEPDSEHFPEETSEGKDEEVSEDEDEEASEDEDDAMWDDEDEDMCEDEENAMQEDEDGH